ncbi:Uncharacterised protein [Vibrio cholerae]|nr:Uncharacterised protein [Vibrio cholerae]CSI80936.1 Uncharacterised protein [Vibrio cholerae]
MLRFINHQKHLYALRVLGQQKLMQYLRKFL